MRFTLPFKIIVLGTLLFASCKSDTNKTDNQEETTVEPTGATYAEIAVADGGAWNGNKYENGTSFKNVNSLNLPSQHTDHSHFIRYEGPGWESDKVGYRLYLDWRNAIDVFGKKTTDMVLSEVGQDGFDSYHEMSDWGLDILKVGKALGIGSYGRLINDSVYHFQALDSTFIEVKNTDSSSSLDINYYGWQTEDIKSDLTTTLSIEPNSRITKVTLSDFTPAPGLVTGIVKLPNTTIMQGDKNAKWNYLATYGEQTIVPDNLGLVIFYKNDDVVGIKDGRFDHLVEFKADKSSIDYQFAAAWAKEKDGITTADEFEAYVKSVVNELNK